jgi:tRNA(Leu) C34 or U34 (ribose-2'-O)-methylase TrmL
VDNPITLFQTNPKQKDNLDYLEKLRLRHIKNSERIFKNMDQTKKQFYTHQEGMKEFITKEPKEITQKGLPIKD